jgi:hypothetical protein
LIKAHRTGTEQGIDHVPTYLSSGEQQRADKRRRGILLMLFLVSLVFIPVVFAFTSPKEISTKQNLEFIPAPNFSSTDVVTGELISLDRLKGNIVLLNFVNYGCNPNVNQIVSEQLLAIKILKEQRGDFIPVSVFCGCCPVNTLRDFATENGLSWPWILDSDYSIIQEYHDYVRIYGYPTLVFINKNQYIEYFSGYNDVSSLSVKIDGMLD